MSVSLCTLLEQECRRIDPRVVMPERRIQEVELIQRIPNQTRALQVTDEVPWNLCIDLVRWRKGATRGWVVG